VVSEYEMAQALAMFAKGLEDALKTWKGKPGLR
jgi:hypothetical protein